MILFFKKLFRTFIFVMFELLFSNSKIVLILQYNNQNFSSVISQNTTTLSESVSLSEIETFDPSFANQDDYFRYISDHTKVKETRSSLDTHHVKPLHLVQEKLLLIQLQRKEPRNHDDSRQGHFKKR